MLRIVVSRDAVYRDLHVVSLSAFPGTPQAKTYRTSACSISKKQRAVIGHKPIPRRHLNPHDIEQILHSAGSHKIQLTRTGSAPTAIHMIRTPSPTNLIGTYKCVTRELSSTRGGGILTATRRDPTTQATSNIRPVFRLRQCSDTIRTSPAQVSPDHTEAAPRERGVPAKGSRISHA